MNSLPLGYRAVVLGASGAIGSAFVVALQADPRCAEVLAVSRQSHPGWDIINEVSVAALAQGLQGPFHFVIDATGALTIDGVGPEKRLDDIAADRLMRSWQVNALGPALFAQTPEPIACHTRKGRLGQALGEGGQHRRQPQRRLVRLPKRQSRAQPIAANHGDRAGTQTSPTRRRRAAARHGAISPESSLRGRPRHGPRRFGQAFTSGP